MRNAASKPNQEELPVKLQLGFTDLGCRVMMWKHPGNPCTGSASSLVAGLELQVLSPGPCKFAVGYKIQ